MLEAIQRAKTIRERLHKPPNAVPDPGINLHARRANFFAIKGWQEDEFRPERIKRIEEPPVPVTLDKIVIRTRCGGTFLAIPAFKEPRELLSLPSEPPLFRAWAVNDIILAVASASKIDVRDLISHRRHSEIIAPRQLAMYLARRLTTKSTPEIGRRFGGRDHSTVYHSLRKLDWLNTALDLPQDVPLSLWAERGWALIQAHGIKGPRP